MAQSNLFSVLRAYEFIETPIFSELLEDLLPDDGLLSMQIALIEDPERGDVIPGGGGIRKVRHALPGRGKSGGVRVIYYFASADGQIYLPLLRFTYRASHRHKPC